MKRIGYVAAILVMLVLAAFARDFGMPKLVPATSMTFNDPHPQEKVTLGVDPYDTPQKASLFRSAMLRHLIMPVLVVFTNDSDETIDLTRANFQLATRDRAKAEPYSLNDLRRVFTSVTAPGSRPQDRLPIPAPGRGKAHGGLSKSEMEELERARFTSRAVEPHSSQQGFLFFDVSGLSDPARGARLYVTGVSDAKRHELMYFEVPLSKE